MRYVDPTGFLSREHEQALRDADGTIPEEELDDMWQGFVDEEAAYKKQLENDINNTKKKVDKKIDDLLNGRINERQFHTALAHAKRQLRGYLKEYYNLLYPSGKIGSVPGYSEDGKNFWRAENDTMIINEVINFNVNNLYTPGSDGYIDPALVKSWAMSESGDYSGIFKDGDTWQSNKKGDWVPEKADIMGATFGEDMSPQKSLNYALKWLDYKGWDYKKINTTPWREKTTYKGIRKALRRYGRGHYGYADEILKRWRRM